MLDAVSAKAGTVRKGQRRTAAPAGIDLIVAPPDGPSSTTVRRRFGSWDAALGAAGLAS
jgi:hypothetical protein